MSQQNETVTIDLIAKYLTGEASPEEAILLDDWLREPENKREFDRLRKLSHLIDDEKVPETPDTQKAWGEFHMSLKNKKARILHPNWMRIAVAACLLGLILTTALLLMDKKDPAVKEGNAQQWIVIQATDNIHYKSLPDGSTITLDKSSLVRLAKSFNQKERKVELQGGAFFQVMPNKNKPFIINAGEVEITVVGTSFNVQQEKDGNRTEVQVVEGIVLVKVASKVLRLTKGQTAVFTADDKQLVLQAGIDVNRLSYATRTFSFQDLPLAEAKLFLEKAFGVSIMLDKERFHECRITAEFENKSLEYILNVISATLDIHFEKQGTDYTVTGKGCH
jgi:ferric-dicitrate binding protein FerR (iron transport regulator)